MENVLGDEKTAVRITGRTFDINLHQITAPLAPLFP
jgi:hypothetical protein